MSSTFTFAPQHINRKHHQQQKHHQQRKQRKRGGNIVLKPQSPIIITIHTSTRTHNQWRKWMLNGGFGLGRLLLLLALLVSVQAGSVRSSWGSSCCWVGSPFVDQVAPTSSYPRLLSHNDHHDVIRNIITIPTLSPVRERRSSLTTATVLDVNKYGSRRHWWNHHVIASAATAIGVCIPPSAFVIAAPAEAVAEAAFAETESESKTQSRRLPMVTTAEFLVLLRDSPRAIQRVEFSGPQSTTVTVQLYPDDAQSYKSPKSSSQSSSSSSSSSLLVFGISDVVESATDPRSPLLIAAYCREAHIPTRFPDLDAALAKVPKRAKAYTNTRVIQANVKEQEKKARMQQDEEEEQRLLRLQQQQQQQ